MKRRLDDVYETPRQLALAMCTWLSQVPLFGAHPRIVVEPHCGSGRFVHAARTVWPSCFIAGFDIRPEVESSARAAGAEVFEARDWLQTREEDRHSAPDLILGNCPFAGVERHVALAVERVSQYGTVAFLLSCNLFWPSEAKEALWDIPGLQVVQPFYPRPDFRNVGSTDAVGVACFVWRKGYQGRPHFGAPRRWRESARRRQMPLVMGGGS